MSELREWVVTSILRLGDRTTTVRLVDRFNHEQIEVTLFPILAARYDVDVSLNEIELGYVCHGPGLDKPKPKYWN